MEWYTIARIYKDNAWTDGNKVEWQRGELISGEMGMIGIGDTASDCDCGVSIELEPMPVCELRRDDDGSMLLDDNSSRLID